VSDAGATLNGSVLSSPNGTVSYWFAYGKTASYGSDTTHRTISTAWHPVSEQVSGVDAGVTYH
jgi:hypothetical protein